MFFKEWSEKIYVSRMNFIEYRHDNFGFVSSVQKIGDFLFDTILDLDCTCLVEKPNACMCVTMLYNVMQILINSFFYCILTGS
jgi:hypothetical protein